MPKIEMLIELLKKIAKTADHVHIEVDYNGREYHWRVHQRNITANEWTPKLPRNHED